MTAAENERLAVVETKVAALKETLDTMNVKMDTVLTFIVSTQAREDRATERAKDESQYRRWLAPILITVVNTVIAAAGFIHRSILNGGG